MLSTILIGNNIVNIAASSLATTFTMKVFGSMYIGVATGVMTLLVLLFGEITPKTIATLKADDLAGKVILSKVQAPVLFFPASSWPQEAGSAHEAPPDRSEEPDTWQEWIRFFRSPSNILPGQEKPDSRSFPS